MASSDGRNPAQSNLHQQDLTKLDVTKLSALSPEVISRQATINIGTIGHVAHGKSTVVKAISGVQTVRFKNELERNITIKLERLSDTVIKVFRGRADEKQENVLYEKIRRTKNRAVTPESDDEIEPPSKKQKLNKKVETYIIEKIIDFKYTNNKEHFYVKWQGYTNDDNTWEPIENLDNCPLILADYVAEEEIKYCQEIEKLKSEISFGDLLSEENLVERLEEAEASNLPKLKEKLILKMIAMITFDESEGNDIPELVQDARNILQLHVAARKRCRQLIELMKWEEHLNQVDKCKKLVVENSVDFAGPPENFTYINQCIPGLNVKIPDDPPIGCECSACNCRAKSCCGMQAGLYAYTVNKRLRVAPGTPIYECNKACKCSSECSNRVVQSGRNIKLCIFRTSTGCGWGVRTEQKIRQGQFLCQYVGEVITFEEAEKRGQEYDANGLTYLFDLDFNSAENLYTVDACQAGNVSHFINHSCDPNLGVWAVWADCLDPNLPMLALFASRDIEAGEEINFDYLQKTSDNDDDGSSASHSVSEEGCKPVGEPSVPNGIEPMTTSEVPASPTKSRFEIHQQNRNHRNYTECKCGTIKCRKYLF